VASNICQALGRGVTRSKRRAQEWMRKAAENGRAQSCITLAARMYRDEPYAREVGHVGEASGVATSAVVTEGHEVPPDVMTGMLHWLRKGCASEQLDPLAGLEELRRQALEGAQHCHNEGCEVVGQLKEFKVCPQCKTSRRRVSETRLECGWAQGKMWEIRALRTASKIIRSRSAGRGT